VSVFGPGKGECIVIGLPGGPWLVVDSFQVKVAGGRSPVAVEYLKRINVTDVAGVFITHWHDDHTRGAAQVLKRYAPTLRYIGLPSGFAEELLTAHDSRRDLTLDGSRTLAA
jgi:glyoxylase-like metal-dependent hydrolase (beta-lactamase superfamily II)